MRCVKTSRSEPTGCLFSPLSSWKPLERERTHARAHARALYLSILPVHPLPPPTPSHVSPRGCQKKWLPFKRPTQRGEITRLSAPSAVRAAQPKFRHASDGFSICIPGAFFLFFASSFFFSGRISRLLQTPARFEAGSSSWFRAVFSSLFSSRLPIGENSHRVKYYVANICLKQSI